MCKKSLLMMLLLALFAPWAANAQSVPYEVQIGEGTSTSGYFPFYTLYNYSIGENLFLASELTEAGVLPGTVTSLSWYATNAPGYEQQGISIWMANVSDEALTTTSHVTTDMTLVYTGSVTPAIGWNEFTFNEETFTWDGTSNILIFCQRNNGDWNSTVNWQATTEVGFNAMTYKYQDSGAYDVTVPNTDMYTSTTRPNIIIKGVGGGGGGPTCARPSTLDVADITGFGATCTWENTGAASYTFEYKATAASDWTVVAGLTANTYALSNLEPMTAYSVRVKAVCDTDLESAYKTANFTTLDVCPDGMVCIGEGTATNSYLPTYFYYNYSLTEQIYTADEIGTAGAIESVDIYSVGTGTRTLEIYMVSTEKRAFEGGDWIPATANDLVFSGEVTFAANSWNTFEFDNPFIYNGTSNVALIVRDMTGSYVSGIQFFVFQAESQALYAYRDGSAYDLAAPGVNGTMATVKNRVRFAIGEPPACPKPTGVTAEVTGNQAVISWTSDAASFNIDINGTVIENVTNPYTFTGDLATTYEVMVQANCGGDGLSEWTNPVSFTTDLCMPEDQCTLTFVVTDSYGDGWNGASIDIYDYTDEEIGDLLASITNQNLDGQTGGVEETQTITLNFCNGQELAIFWTSGSYDDEASYSITDLNGDVVVEGEGEGFDAFAYTINCTVTDCRKPTNLAASEIANHSVVLSWTENGPATEWIIEYLSENDTVTTTITVNTNPYTLTGLTPETMYAAQVTPVCEVEKPSEVIYWTTDVACPKPTNLSATPYPFTANVEWDGYAEAYEIEWVEMPEAESKDALWLQYDNGTYVGAIGNSSANTWTWGVMYPASMLNGNGLVSKVSIYENSNNTEDITINIYSGGDDAPETLVYTETITPEGAGAFHEITLAEPVNVDPSQNLWITLTEYGTYVMSYCQNGDNANNDWVLSGSSWAHIGDLSSSLAGDTWMIRGYVEPAYDPSTLDWTTVTGITSPYLIEGLQPETQYIVRVKALCGGEDGESLWTYAYFTTPSACDMPIDLVAEDITYNSATLNWTGYQESFNVKYRQVPHGEVYASANFDDNSMGEWTTIDADGDGYDWVLGSECGGVYLAEGGSLAGTGHNSSTDLVVSGSYSNVSGVGALEPDNYLVSPQVTLGGSITFWACGQDASYVAEHFGVAVSTTGNTDAADFTTIWETTMTAKGGNDRGKLTDLVLPGRAKTEPAATTRSGNRAQGTWYQFTVDLSEYSGQGYVAIRHFDCTDMFMLDVDDIVIEGAAPTIEWNTVTVTEPTLALTGLTPETEYEWQVQGINPSCDGGLTEWTEITTFTTLEQTTVTQTIALVEGANYVSFYVDITLNDLKAALVEVSPNATIKITGQNNSTTYDPQRHRWNGNMQWDVDQMYIVRVAADCEISLEGMLIDPSEHPITIVSGANYIAFPLTNNKSLTDAFAGFAVNGDKILSKMGSATYTRGRWQGQSLTELKPGDGYIYKSATAESRTLVFPSAK